MIKKMMFLLMGFFLISIATKAENSKQILFEQLPPQAQRFVRVNLQDLPISYIMQDEEGLFGKEYDVIFTNGNKIEFDRKGLWKQIDYKKGIIPDRFLPYQIRSFLQAKYRVLEVVEMERDSDGYEIKLSDGMELHFNKKFELVEVDD